MHRIFRGIYADAGGRDAGIVTDGSCGNHRKRQADDM